MPQVNQAKHFKKWDNPWSPGSFLVILTLSCALLACPAAHADKKQLAETYARKAAVENLEMATRVSALNHINQAIAIDSTNSNYYHIKSTIYWKQEEDRAALDNINRALELNPDVPAFYDTKATILQSMGRAAEALKLIDRAIKLKELVEFRCTRASLLDSLRRFDEAKVEIDKAVKQEPKNPLPRIRRVTINTHLKNWQGIIEDMTFLIGAGEQNSFSYFMHFVDRGNAYMMLKQYDKAQKDLLFALKKMPDRRETHTALLALYKATGRPKEAAKEAAILSDLDEDIKPFK